MLIEYHFKCLELGEKNLFREVKILRCDALNLQIQILRGGDDDDDHGDAHHDVHDELFHWMEMYSLETSLLDLSWF